MSHTEIIILYVLGLMAVFAEILLPGMIIGICGTFCVAGSIYQIGRASCRERV